MYVMKWLALSSIRRIHNYIIQKRLQFLCSTNKFQSEKSTAVNVDKSAIEREQKMIHIS